MDRSESQRCEEEFLRQLLRHQAQLRAYLFSMTADRTATDDLLQETNLTLWRKADEYRPGSPFLHWACRVAYWKVREHRTRQRREKLVFDDEQFEVVSERFLVKVHAGSSSEKLEFLHECLQEIPEQQRRVLRQRYSENLSPRQIARKSGKSPNSVVARLYRIRLSLLHCIERKIVAARGSP